MLHDDVMPVGHLSVCYITPHSTAAAAGWLAVIQGLYYYWMACSDVSVCMARDRCVCLCGHVVRWDASDAKALKYICSLLACLSQAHL